MYVKGKVHKAAPCVYIMYILFPHNRVPAQFSFMSPDCSSHSMAGSSYGTKLVYLQIYDRLSHIFAYT